MGCLLAVFWFKAVEKPGKHSLLVTTAKSFRWSILAGVFPRLCMTGFTYAQPFLINTLINYIESSDPNVDKNYGYGLIGAYVLVFFGGAVSFLIYEGTTDWHGLIPDIFGSLYLWDPKSNYKDSRWACHDHLLKDTRVAYQLSQWQSLFKFDEHRCGKNCSVLAVISQSLGHANRTRNCCLLAWKTNWGCVCRSGDSCLRYMFTF